MALTLFPLTRLQEDSSNPRFVLNGTILSGKELIAVKRPNWHDPLVGYVYEQEDREKGKSFWRLNTEPFLKHPYLTHTLEEGDPACFVHLKKNAPDHLKNPEGDKE